VEVVLYCQKKGRRGTKESSSRTIHFLAPTKKEKKGRFQPIAHKKRANSYPLECPWCEKEPKSRKEEKNVESRKKKGRTKSLRGGRKEKERAGKKSPRSGIWDKATACGKKKGSATKKKRNSSNWGGKEEEG